MLFKPRSFNNRYNEQTKKDVPQIKTQLSSKVRPNVARILRVVFILIIAGVYPQALLLIDVGSAHGNGDREYRDVHHDDVRHLDGWMVLSKTNHRQARRAGSCSLK